MVVFFEVVIWLMIATALVVNVWMFFEVLMTPPRAFKKIGQSKPIWLLMIFFLGIFASLPYILFFRTQVAASAAINSVRGQKTVEFQ